MAKHGPNLLMPWAPVTLGVVRRGYTFVNAEAAALVARFTTPATNARKALIDNLVGALKTAGVWTLLDALYVMAAADSQAASLNWVSTSFDLVSVGTGNPTFVADRGFTGAGNNGKSTQFTPSTAPSPKFTLNGGHISDWSRTNAQSSGFSMGARITTATGQTFIISRNASDQAISRVNQDVSGTAIGNLDSSGMFLATRSASNARVLYRNAVSLGAAADVSSNVPTFPIYICGVNTAGAFASGEVRQHAAASIGGSLDATQVLAFYNALQAYMTAVGA